MKYTMDSIKDLLDKRATYMDTARKVYEDNTDKNGKFKDNDSEVDFVRLCNKINDAYDSAMRIVNVIDKDKKDEYKTAFGGGVSGIDSLTMAIDAYDEYKKTPVNQPVYPNIGSAHNEGGKGACMTIESKKFNAMFGNGSGRGGFKNFNEFLSVLQSGRFDDRLIGSGFNNLQTEGVGSAGGFSVPEEFAGWLVDQALENEIVRPRAQVWPMKTETRKIPAWDSADHSASLYGGFAGVWIGEGATNTRQSSKLRLMQLTARKMAIFAQASNELLADGMDFENQLGQAMIKSLAWSMDYYFLNGTGAGQPLGVLKDPALVTVAKEAAQPADSIVYQNLTKMLARMAPQCINKSVWICSSTTIPELLTLGLAIGAGGSHIPVMSEENGQYRILSRPVIFTEKLPSLGNLGDVLLADLSQYAVGLRKDVSLDKSNVPGWLEDSQDYRAIVRLDGQGTWDKAITPKNGDSLSWCVTLAERA